MEGGLVSYKLVVLFTLPLQSCRAAQPHKKATAKSFPTCYKIFCLADLWSKKAYSQLREGGPAYIIKQIASLVAKL